MLECRCRCRTVKFMCNTCQITISIAIYVLRITKEKKKWHVNNVHVCALLHTFGEHRLELKMKLKRCLTWFIFVLLVFAPSLSVSHRFMPDVPDAERHTDNKKYIETAFGVLCNTPLLSNHTASWEMLVSKRTITEYNTEGNLTAHIPVI